MTRRASETRRESTSGPTPGINALPLSKAFRSGGLDLGNGDPGPGLMSLAVVCIDDVGRLLTEARNHPFARKDELIGITVQINLDHVASIDLSCRDKVG